MDPSNKILICIPFWKGDKAQAMKLARLIADLQEEHSVRADVLFCARFDCPHDRATIDYVARKFNVYAHTSQRREVGWPHGCNGIFFGMIEWFHGMIESERVPKYKALFIAESDGAPLTYDWLSRLVWEWDKVNELKKVYMAGALVPDIENNHPHINGGCAFLSGDMKFLHWLVKKVGGINIAAGWDWILHKRFEEWGWSDIPSIKSYWRRPAFTESDWLPEIKKGTVWLHGVKDDSLLDLSRKKLL
jgi:hypothetical protein